MKWKYLYKSMAAAMVISLTVPTIVLAQQAETKVQTEGATEGTGEAETPAPPPPEPIPEPETPSPETIAPEIPEEPVTTPEEPITEAPIIETPPSETETPPTSGDVINDPGKEGGDVPEETESNENRTHNKDDMDKEPVDYTPDARFSQIVTPGSIKTSFRFSTIDKVYGLAKADSTRVYGEAALTSKAVGVLHKADICYILEDSKNDFYYIESGNVRGFVKKTAVETGSIAEKKIRLKGEMRFSVGKAIVAPSQNPAWAYLKVTTQKTLVDKEYAIVTAEGGLSIREARQKSAKVIGKVPDGGLCYVLADEDKDWVYVESSNVRGFVKAENLKLGKEADKAVEEKGEDRFSLASQIVEPEENKACYYTLTSVKEPLDDNVEFLGDFTLTAYCSCPVCCGQWSGGPTASGAYPAQGKTVAMGGVPFGTKLVINGEVYTVEDRGTPYGHVDVYKVSHSEAAAFGKQKAPVYLLKEADDTLEAKAE